MNSTEITYITNLELYIENSSIEKILNNINRQDYFAEIVQYIFNEPNIVYIDNEDGRTILEVHFDDCNYYEIDTTDINSKEELVNKLVDDLIKERVLDKSSIGINRNNIRYLRKRRR